MQRAAGMKVDLLDLAGIVELKNQLIRALTQLYDIEHELVYKKQRNQLRYNRPQVPRPQKLPQFPPQIEKLTLQVPTYNSRQQQNLSKIDRVTSYLHDLRKNMRRLSTAVFKNYETTDFLKNQPEYLQLKEKLERYKMRNQELGYLLQQKIEEQVERFIANCQCVEDNDQYKVIKVYDSDVDGLGKCYELTQVREWDEAIVVDYDDEEEVKNFNVNRKMKPQLTQVNSDKDIRSLRLIKSKTQHDTSQLKKSSSKDPHDTSMKKTLSNSRVSKRSSKIDSQIKDPTEEKSNYVYMVHNFGAQNQKNSSIISSLSSLRSKRKKVFDDDIWNEFDKI